MKNISKILNNTFGRFRQGKNGRNRTALNGLRELGYPMPRIRKALVDLNGINIRELSEGDGVSVPTLYNTLRGTRGNRQAREALAASLGLEKEELFPPEG